MKYAKECEGLNLINLEGKIRYGVEKVDQNHIGLTVYLHGFHLAL
jgi:hypothetical protein